MLCVFEAADEFRKLVNRYGISGRSIDKQDQFQPLTRWKSISGKDLCNIDDQNKTWYGRQMPYSLTMKEYTVRDTISPRNYHACMQRLKHSIRILKTGTHE